MPSNAYTRHSQITKPSPIPPLFSSFIEYYDPKSLNKFF